MHFFNFCFWAIFAVNLNLAMNFLCDADFGWNDDFIEPYESKFSGTFNPGFWSEILPWWF